MASGWFMSLVLGWIDIGHPGLRIQLLDISLNIKSGSSPLSLA